MEEYQSPYLAITEGNFEKYESEKIKLSIKSLISVGMPSSSFPFLWTCCCHGKNRQIEEHEDKNY